MVFIAILLAIGLYVVLTLLLNLAIFGIKKFLQFLKNCSRSWLSITTKLLHDSLQQGKRECLNDILFFLCLDLPGILWYRKLNLLLFVHFHHLLFIVSYRLLLQRSTPFWGVFLLPQNWLNLLKKLQIRPFCQKTVWTQKWTKIKRVFNCDK